MSDNQPIPAIFQSYLQADAPSRSSQFAAFVQGLKALAASEGADATRVWAARAVSPLLDYSSLLKLKKYLPHLSGTTLRLAILGGPTTTQFRQLVELFLASENIAAEIYESDYGLFRQEILSPGSGLDEFQPTLIIVATGSRDVSRFPSIEMREEDVAALAAQEVDDWSLLWETANARWNATLIQNNFEIQPGSVLGHYRLRHPAAREHYLERLNRLLAERAPAYVVLHDLQGLAAEVGARNWFDPRFYHEFKMPCGAEALVT